jgi:apolipoprotein N-acyltransferase
VRATASGLTAHVDPWGRLRGSLPYYQEAYLTVRLEIPELPPTFYTRHGDWFPRLCLAATALLALTAVFGTVVGRIGRGAPSRSDTAQETDSHTEDLDRVQ